MNWEAISAITELIGLVGIVVSLAYLSIQIRSSNRVASAQARQSMSEFVMSISTFRSEHADRYAKLESEVELSEGDLLFQFWGHMQMMSFGEAYFHQFKLGLMPEMHWQGFSSWIEGYVDSNGFSEFWEHERGSFSDDYVAWVEERIARRDTRSISQ